MSNFKKSIILVKIYSSILDPIFEIAKIKVDLSIKYIINGTLGHTNWDYPEIDYEGVTINNITLNPIEEKSNNILVNFLLNKERKKEIENFTKIYIRDNWLKGENIESQIFYQASEEYQALMETLAEHHQQD